MVGLGVDWIGPGFTSRLSGGVPLYTRRYGAAMLLDPGEWGRMGWRPSGRIPGNRVHQDFGQRAFYREHRYRRALILRGFPGCRPRNPLNFGDNRG